VCADGIAEKKSQPGEAAGCGNADGTNALANVTPVFIVDAAIIGCTFFLDYSRCAGSLGRMHRTKFFFVCR
jgi:hypothetical protein